MRRTMCDDEESAIRRFASDYLRDIADLAITLPVDQLVALVDILQQLRKKGGKILLCGNGGSSATAEHWANDLSRSGGYPDVPFFRAMALSGGTPLVTALANDHGYEHIFSEQVEQWIESGDLLIAFSSRGNSPNVLRAIECAKRRGATTVGLTGFDGGGLRKIADLCILVNCESIERAEDMHLIIGHIVIMAIRHSVHRSSTVEITQVNSPSRNGHGKV